MGCSPPSVSRLTNNPGTYNFYSDGLGENFSGTGWYSEPEYYLKDCGPVVELYDCINGDCLNSTVYKTPGKFQNLAACRSECSGGGGTPCAGECIPLEEIAALQQAASNIRSRLCK